MEADTEAATGGVVEDHNTGDWSYELAKRGCQVQEKRSIRGCRGNSQPEYERKRCVPPFSEISAEGNWKSFIRNYFASGRRRPYPNASLSIWNARMQVWIKRQVGY